MGNRIRLGMIKNRLTPVIIVFGMIMIGLGMLLYVRTDEVVRKNESDRVEKSAHDAGKMFSQSILGELNRLASVASVAESLENSLEGVPLDIIKDYLTKGFADNKTVFTGVIAADGSEVFGQVLSATEYEGIMKSLRGQGCISYTPGGGFLFSYPVKREGNVKYVMYELWSSNAFAEYFDMSGYKEWGKPTLMAKEGSVIIPFDLDVKDNEKFYNSRTVRKEFTRLVRNMDIHTSIVSYKETTEGEMYFYVADVEGTDFVFAGIVNRSEVKDNLSDLPALIFTIILLLSVMVTALAFFLMVMGQRVRESKALKQAKVAAEEASKAKSDFLANMSHEIRTPINTVLGMDELILRETNDPSLRKYAVNIQRAGQALLSQINDILDFSKIEAGKMELIPVEYDLYTVIANMIDMVNARALAKGLVLELDVDSETPQRLIGDNVRIQQIILNLMTNAIKYTREGRVTLAVTYQKITEDEIDLCIAVKDTGIGIKKEDQEKLFSAFERIEEERNRTVEGTGLGMNIVCSLLDLMDSKLKVDSVYGEGSTFSFNIRQKVVSWDPIGDVEHRADNLANIEETYHVSFTAPDARILIVDDTEMNLMVVRGLLKSTEMEIHTAVDGKQALSMTEKNVYDILLIDHRMPVMDGMEMIRQLRGDSNNKNQKKPCVALTANAIAGAREEYLNAGFDDYMIKPVNGTALEELLIKYLPYQLVNIEHDFNEESEESQKQEDDPAKKYPVLAQIEEKGYLDIREGVEYAGTSDMYMTALKFFAGSIETKSDEIREYYENEDWENYQTKVHALKSSAKMIGAMELSNRARALELAAKDKDLEYIREHNGDVLTFYGSYMEKLKGL